MAKRMIMLGGWTSIYEKAKACDFHLTVIQRKIDIKLKDIEVIDQIMSSPLDDDGIVDLVAAMHAQKPFDVVVSFQEFGLLNAALIKERLGISGNPLTPVLLTRDKGKMRMHLREKGLSSIPFALVGNVDEVLQLAGQTGWPIIVKPVNGTGSRQIHKLFSATEVAPALASIAKDFPGADIIAEQFVEGPEISVEAITWEGKHTILGVTDKLTNGFPYFVETGHSMPSALPPETIAKVHELTLALLESIGHVYGPSHTEIIISEHGPVIVESHTRTGGDRIFDMVDLAYGVDMFGATLKGFAGDFPPIEVQQKGGAAIRYLMLPEGQVDEIDGVESAKRAPGVVGFDVGLKVGDRVNAVRNSTQRYGYVLAVGECGRAAIDNVTNAMDKIRIGVALQQ